MTVGVYRFGGVKWIVFSDRRSCWSKVKDTERTRCVWEKFKSFCLAGLTGHSSDELERNTKVVLRITLTLWKTVSGSAFCLTNTV